MHLLHACSSFLLQVFVLTLCTLCMPAFRYVQVFFFCALVANCTPLWNVDQTSIKWWRLNASIVAINSIRNIKQNHTKSIISSYTTIGSNQKHDKTFEKQFRVQLIRYESDKQNNFRRNNNLTTLQKGFKTQNAFVKTQQKLI